jgi:glycosyltransferase involved in cell wall biosynthesis
LILATVDRIREVERFLKSLDSQTHRAFELIVVDQNKDERLLPLLAAYREKFSILHLKSEPGSSRARNIGLRHITGNVVAFPDDDCWYPPQLLEHITGFFCEHPELDGFTVRMADESGQSGATRFDKKPGLLSQTNAWRRVATFTIFFRRIVVEAVGEFDEALGPGAGTIWGGGEDIDYALRATEADFKVYYRPDIYIFHPSYPSPPEYDYSKLGGRAYGYNVGIGRVWRKHNYPLWFVAYYLLRSIGGAALSLVQGDKGKAYFYFRSLRGRLRGWLSR